MGAIKGNFHKISPTKISPAQTYLKENENVFGTFWYYKG